jgi:hypothetical protein
MIKVVPRSRSSWFFLVLTVETVMWSRIVFVESTVIRSPSQQWRWEEPWTYSFERQPQSSKQFSNIGPAYTSYLKNNRLVFVTLVVTVLAWKRSENKTRKYLRHLTKLISIHDIFTSHHEWCAIKYPKIEYML